LYFVGISTQKYLEQGRCLRGWPNLSINGLRWFF